jgi:Holliday junction resolvasome RuvABC endonuclease subunit
VARLLALDPSLTATGWAVLDLRHGCVEDVGVIRTKLPPKAKRHHYQGDTDDARVRALAQGVAKLYRIPGVAVVAKEAAAGSRHVKAAKALAYAQAVPVALAVGLGVGELLNVQAEEAKRAATGKKSATKDEVAAGVFARWPEAQALVEALKPASIHEHATDALAVAMAVWDSPAVAGLRRFSDGG